LFTRPPASRIAVAALGAASHSPELAAYARSSFADRLARERPIFDRAIARGELPAQADPMLLMDLLAGAVRVRAVLRQAGFGASVVGRLFAAIYSANLDRAVPRLIAEMNALPVAGAAGRSIPKPPRRAQG
jgi:Tetracyclin repressor-like, C-terminal domain